MAIAINIEVQNCSSHESKIECLYRTIKLGPINLCMGYRKDVPKQTRAILEQIEAEILPHILPRIDSGHKNQH